MVNMSGFTYPRVSNSIVKEFVSLTAQAESASAVAGAGGGTFLTSIGEDGADMMSQLEQQLPGLTLFPSQIEKITQTHNCLNPLFLSLLLQALRWSATRGYDIRRLLDQWLEADSLTALYGDVLDVWETGQDAPSSSHVADCERFAKKAGGFPTLRENHPLHQHIKASRRARLEAEEKRVKDEQEHFGTSELEWLQTQKEADKVNSYIYLKVC